MKALLPKWRPSEGKRFHDVNPHPVRSAFRQITSFILPVTVLILVPWLIEDDFSVKQDGWSLAGALLMLAGMKLLSATVFLFMTIGKGMGCGFPISGLVSTDEITASKPFSKPSSSSSSYGGNPLASTAALATIRTILDDLTDLAYSGRHHGPAYGHVFEDLDWRQIEEVLFSVGSEKNV